MHNYKQITLQLEQETLERLKEQAQKEGDRPVASLIREILQREISVSGSALDPLES
ncbi:MAG: ribbon-helix-helix protein, CopG family [Coraliomargarita sp.]